MFEHRIFTGFVYLLVVIEPVCDVAAFPLAAPYTYGDVVK